MKRTTIILTFAAMLVAACTTNDKKKQIEENTRHFVENYLCCRYKQAMQYCTPESQCWVIYAASNVTQEDVDAINAMKEKTTCKTTNIEIYNDSTSMATVKARNFFMMDSIGVTGKVIPEAYFTMTLKRREGKWSVHLTSLPQVDKEMH